MGASNINNNNNNMNGHHGGKSAHQHKRTNIISLLDDDNCDINTTNTNTTTAVSNAAATTDSTLEIFVISNTMKPSLSAASEESQNEMDDKMLLDAFNQLSPSDASLLTLTELFTFRFRVRDPNTEPLVMPNTKHYIDALSTKNSPLISRIDQIVGFRCRGCRHTVLDEFKDLYKPGAAQLLSSDSNVQAISEAITQLRTHLIQCEFVSDNIRSSLSLTSGGHNISQQSKSLHSYLEIWHKKFIQYCTTHDFPKLKLNGQQYLQPHHHQPQHQPQPQQQLHNNNFAFPRTLNNGYCNHQQYKVTETAQQQQFQSQQQQQQQQLNVYPYQVVAVGRPKIVSPQPLPRVDSQEIILEEMDNCISKALVYNNFGLATRKPHLIATDLTELPAAPDVIESPFVELLLQSFAVLNQWNPPSSEHGCHDGGYNTIVLQCRYCHSEVTNFCLNGPTGSAEAAAKYINRTGGVHLCQECDQIPTSLRKKLIALRPLNKSKDDDNNHHVIEKHFEIWKSWHRATYNRDDKVSPSVKNVELWKTLTWDIIKKNGGASLKYESLGTPTTPAVPATSKKLVHPVAKNDVLFGWHGSHVGNRRFHELLIESQYLSYKASNGQQRFLACTIAQRVIGRGGKFYQILAPNAAPEPLSMEQVVKFTCRALTYGFGTVIQPPLCPVMQCEKGGRVLETDYAPTVGIFRGQIDLSRPLKKLKLDPQPKPQRKFGMLKEDEEWPSYV